MSEVKVEDAQPDLVPLRLLTALLLFGVPAVAFRVALYGGTGLLITRGASLLAAVYLAFLVPSILLLSAAFVALRLDGYRLSWNVVRRRFRFDGMRPRIWLWAVPGALVALVGSQLLSFTSVALVHVPFFSPPSYLSFLNPAASQPAHSFLGVSLRGNWTLVAAFSVLVVIQVLAEECWWRGYIFPRQERAYGRWTWPIHGTLWAAFHFVFYPWNLVIDLFFCNIVAFVVQRTRSTWSSLILHLLYNGLTPLTLALAAAGAVS